LKKVSKKLNNDIIPTEDILTPREVALFLRFSYRNVMELIHTGDIPASRIGGSYRISKMDLKYVWEKNRVKTA
jgi:excisionase family DNA binding protein